MAKEHNTLLDKLSQYKIVYRTYLCFACRLVTLNPFLDLFIYYSICYTKYPIKGFWLLEIVWHLGSKFKEQIWQ